MSRKVTIIGAGSVGSTIAYTMAVNGLAGEVVMIDINTSKALGEAMDIRQGTPFCAPIQIYAGTYADAAGSDVVIVDHPNEADAVLDLLREERDREILSINDMGQAREYELTLTLEFRITAPEGFEWLEATRLSTTRDISYNESEFLSREKEENVLYDDMESDLINQLVRYIEAVKPRDSAY